MELQTYDGIHPQELPDFKDAIENLKKKHKQEFGDWSEINTSLEKYNSIRKGVLSGLKENQ